MTGVVIIDDSSQWIHRVASVVAEIPGLAVLGSAGTPSAALELVSRLRPPIMILDMSLSGGSGVDVLKELDPRGAGDIRVVVVTGSPSSPLRQVCLESGARYFFDKAFEFDLLEDALRSLRDEVSISPV
jgi:DNA-binding NarL/FixJ family response regulator